MRQLESEFELEQPRDAKLFSLLSSLFVGLSSETSSHFAFGPPNTKHQTSWRALDKSSFEVGPAAGLRPVQLSSSSARGAFYIHEPTRLNSARFTDLNGRELLPPPAVLFADFSSASLWPSSCHFNSAQLASLLSSLLFACSNCGRSGSTSSPNFLLCLLLPFPLLLLTKVAQRPLEWPSLSPNRRLLALFSSHLRTRTHKSWQNVHKRMENLAQLCSA